MIFGKTKQPSPQQPMQYLQLLNGFTPFFSDTSQTLEEHALVKTAIDTLARNMAKLKPKHIRRVNGQVLPPSTARLEYLLCTRPNPHMDAYSFHYKMASSYFYKNNAFAFVEYDESGNYKSLYPVDFSRMELMEYKNEMYCQFHFSSGKKLTVPYSQVIHLRRFFHNHEIYGDTDTTALHKILDLVHTTDEGIVNAIKSSAYLRGLLKFPAMLNDTDLKKSRERFVSEFLDMTKEGGIAAMDSRADYKELNAEPKMVTHEQMKLIENKVYKYFNLSENIIKSSYNEDEWNAFYESMIEPYAIHCSLEYSSKLFSTREQGWGNEIIFEANRLQYASNNTKVAVVTLLMDRGMMTINQALDVFNMPPIDGGDKRVMSLNYVDADIANQYQLGKTGQDQPSPTQDGGEPDGNQSEG
jgi:HK97 family phage portal protein